MKHTNSTMTNQEVQRRPHPSNLWTLEETAKFLHITYARAAELARTKRIPGVVRLGRQIRIYPDVLLSFVADGGQPLPGGWKKEADNGR